MLFILVFFVCLPRMPLSWQFCNVQNMDGFVSFSIIICKIVSIFVRDLIIRYALPAMILVAIIYIIMFGDNSIIIFDRNRRESISMNVVSMWCME